MAALTQPVTLLIDVGVTGPSGAVQADAGQPAFLQVTGITTATVALEGSLDGISFSTVETALTADGLIIAPHAPKYLRANVTAWTAGAITAKILY